jgi:hypothetical protein
VESLDGRRGRRAAAALAVSVTLVGALIGAPSVAQQPAPPESTAVDASFKRGLELFDAQDYLGAAAVWEPLSSPAGGGRWKVLYNLGLAYQAAGDATRAVERFQAFAAAVEREATRPPDLEERRQDALDRVRALEAATGAVQIKAPLTGPAPAIRVDGGPARPAGFTARLSPGAHVIEIGEGASARRVELRVVAGGSIEVDTSAPPPRPIVAPTAGAAPSTTPPPTDAPSFPTLWVLLGVAATGASLALPLTLRGDADDARTAAEELGPGHTGYGAAVQEYESARSTYYAGWALPAALGAITAGIAVYGVVHVATGGPPAKAAGLHRHVEIGAGAVPGSATAWARGSF